MNEGTWKDSEFEVGELVKTPSGNIEKIEAIIQGLHWLESGVFAYEFELEKIKRM